MEPIAPKIVTTITLPPSLRDELDAEAAKQDRSRSWISTAAIREYLARRAEETANDC
jgi:predicted transcriptional regulator